MVGSKDLIPWGPALPRVCPWCPDLEPYPRSGECPLSRHSASQAFDPPPQLHEPLSHSERKAVLESRNDALLCLSVQVEILNEHYQTLHRLHGEQVEAGSGGGGRRWGTGALECSTGLGGGNVQERVPVWAGDGDSVSFVFLQMASYFGHSIAVTDVNGDG